MDFEGDGFGNEGFDDFMLQGMDGEINLSASLNNLGFSAGFPALDDAAMNLSSSSDQILSADSTDLSAFPQSEDSTSAFALFPISDSDFPAQNPNNLHSGHFGTSGNLGNNSHSGNLGNNLHSGNNGKNKRDLGNDMEVDSINGVAVSSSSTVRPSIMVKFPATSIGQKKSAPKKPLAQSDGDQMDTEAPTFPLPEASVSGSSGGNRKSPADVISATVEANTQSRQSLASLLQQQRDFILNLPNGEKARSEGVAMLLTMLSTLSNGLVNQSKLLHYVLDNALIEPYPLHQLYYLMYDIELQQSQIRLLSAEIDALKADSAPSLPICALAIAQQPFPEVIFKDRQIARDVLSVVLLTGSGVEVQNISKVIAGMHFTDGSQSQSKKDKALIANGEQDMDASKRKADFPLKFPQGTRHSVVTLSFSALVQLKVRSKSGYKSITPTLESDASQPFVVITNEGQWESSEEKLFKLELFHNKTEVSWLMFCNALQRRFIRATRQVPAKPERYLSKKDFEYFRARFFGNQEKVDQAHFEAFWAWFGKILQEIRYKKHSLKLYTVGVIYGCLSRDEVHASLSGHAPGTSLIRWSESSPGQVAIGYVGAQGEFKHYLVEVSDLSSKRQLADFIVEKDQFKQILFCCGYDNGRPTFKVVPKVELLRQYLTPTSQVPQSERAGYDPLDMSWNSVSSPAPKLHLYEYYSLLLRPSDKEVQKWIEEASRRHSLRPQQLRLKS